MGNNIVYLGLGSNLGDRNANLEIALLEIEKIAKIVKKSGIYETIPQGYKDQGKFLNMAIEIQTELPPPILLYSLQKIEADMGRDRKNAIKWGPRIIDIDILLYNDLIIETESLKVPHPQIAERDFVLIPMMDIAPNKIHPKLKKDIKTLHEWINKK
jgi:2-amino-4-hydroxy-6-hydroxymethyldihydropteridine diphosphokinase